MVAVEFNATTKSLFFLTHDGAFFSTLFMRRKRFWVRFEPSCGGCVKTGKFGMKASLKRGQNCQLCRQGVRDLERESRARETDLSDPFPYLPLFP